MSMISSGSPLKYNASLQNSMPNHNITPSQVSVSSSSLFVKKSNDSDVQKIVSAFRNAVATLSYKEFTAYLFKSEFKDTLQDERGHYFCLWNILFPHSLAEGTDKNIEIFANYLIERKINFQNDISSCFSIKDHFDYTASEVLECIGKNGDIKVLVVYENILLRILENEKEDLRSDVIKKWQYFKTNTALIYAVKSRCKSIKYLEYCIEKLGNNLGNCLPKSGRNAFHYAAKNGDVATLNFLMQKEDDENKKIVNSNQPKQSYLRHDNPFKKEFGDEEVEIYRHIHVYAAKSLNIECMELVFSTLKIDENGIIPRQVFFEDQYPLEEVHVLDLISKVFDVDDAEDENIARVYSYFVSKYSSKNKESFK